MGHRYIAILVSHSLKKTKQNKNKNKTKNKQKQTNKQTNKQNKTKLVAMHVKQVGNKPQAQSLRGSYEDVQKGLIMLIRFFHILICNYCWGKGQAGRGVCEDVISVA